MVSPQGHGNTSDEQRATACQEALTICNNDAVEAIDSNRSRLVDGLLLTVCGGTQSCTTGATDGPSNSAACCTLVGDATPRPGGDRIISTRLVGLVTLSFVPALYGFGDNTASSNHFTPSPSSLLLVSLPA